MKKVVLILLVSLLCVESLMAQGSAGQAGSFLRWGAGAKAMGLGRAFTAISDDASALFWNPAGLAALSKVGGTFMVMHLPLRQGASYNYVAGAIPLRLFFTKARGASGFVHALQDLKLGLGRVWVSLGDFERYDAIGNPVSNAADNGIDQAATYFSVSYPLNFLFNKVSKKGSLGWARFLRGDLEMGLTTKFISQDLFGFNGSATGFDLGFKYSHHSGWFSLGLMFRDITNETLSFGAEVLGDKIPTSGTLGVALSPILRDHSGLLLSFDYAFQGTGAQEGEVMFGLEYDLSLLRSDLPIKLRLGTNSEHESITFGINFSPEVALGKDWVPYGDYTYANDRGSFDAVGARYSFSVDRNPFTAKYWYQNGMVLFNGLAAGDLALPKNAGSLERYFRNARRAKNPGNHAYRYEAALRQADVAFLTLLAELLRSDYSDSLSRRKTSNHAQEVSKQYAKQALKYLYRDSGKNEIDSQAYFRSFLYYVQSLILAGDEQTAIEICRNSGKSWGKKIDLLSDNQGHTDHDRWAYLDYLLAYSLYKSNLKTDAVTLIERRQSQTALTRYFWSHVLFLSGDYAGVLKALSGFDLNESRFPVDIFLPLTHDRTFGDEVLFLRAASMFKMPEEYRPRDYVTEFAKIPRFFPNSDLARFLTNGNDIMTRIVEDYETHDSERLVRLVTKTIDSYLKTFSSGTLNENIYTQNY